jgi:hypothetical protein
VKKPLLIAVPLFVVASAVAACNGTTGDEIVTFPAYAAGAKGAGDPFESNGWKIQLTFAQMFVGAVYVNEAPPQNGATFNTPTCIDPGIYCGQVPGGVEVNLLSSEPQPFSVQGSGTADLGLSWEIYLVDGDVNNPEITTFGVPNSVDLMGTATRDSDGLVVSWGATVTINSSNRGIPASQAGQPGAYPICHQRIIELGDLSLQLYPGGSMLLTIDPRGWFLVPINFSTLPSVDSPQCGLDQGSIFTNDGGVEVAVCIPDSSLLTGTELGQEQGLQLLRNIQTAGSAAYVLTYGKSP